MFHILCKAAVIVTKLWAGRPMNRLSIFGGVKKFFSSPDCPQQSWILLSLLVSGYPGGKPRFPGLKWPERNHRHVVPW